MSSSLVIASLLSVGAAAYLLGCLNGAIIVSNLLYGDDIRHHGSGNAGLTNFYRTYGAKYSPLVIFVDMAKAALAVWIGSAVLGGFFGWTLSGKYYAALLCVVGHMFPASYSFRGGKGILCSATLLLLLDWRVALVGWGLFLLLWLLTRYVSLGSVVAAVSFPVTTALIYRDAATTALALVIALLVLYAHRSNIVRLMNGTENKFRFHVNAPKTEDKA